MCFILFGKVGGARNGEKKMANEKRLIDEMRVCPFDGQLVVCDSDCDNCDWAEDKEDEVG
jgi:hypothetical protein